MDDNGEGRRMEKERKEDNNQDLMVKGQHRGCDEVMVLYLSDVSDSRM